MKKLLRLLSVIIAFSVLFTYGTAFTTEENNDGTGDDSTPVVITLDKNKGFVTENSELNLIVKFTNAPSSIYGYSITIKSLSEIAVLGVGEMNGNTVTPTVSDDKYTYTETFSEPTVLGALTVKTAINKLPLGTIELNSEIAVLIAEETEIVTDSEGAKATVNVNTDNLSINITKEAPSAKISLADKIESLDDISVTLKKSETETENETENETESGTGNETPPELTSEDSTDDNIINTIITLMKDGKTIAVELEDYSVLEVGASYEVITKGKNWLNTSETVNSFTVSEEGKMEFDIKDFYCGDLKIDGVIDVYDFHRLAVNLSDYDLNADGSSNKEDLVFFAENWRAYAGITNTIYEEDDK